MRIQIDLGHVQMSTNIMKPRLISQLNLKLVLNLTIWRDAERLSLEFEVEIDLAMKLKCCYTTYEHTK